MRIKACTVFEGAWPEAYAGNARLPDEVQSKRVTKPDAWIAVNGETQELTCINDLRSKSLLHRPHPEGTIP